MLTKEQQHLHDTTLRSALATLLKYVRDLAQLDEVQPPDGVFRNLNYMAQSLTGLKQSMKAYDDIVQHFEKLDNETRDS